jgi:Mrp family chromosome partitioning ATPase
VDQPIGDDERTPEEVAALSRIGVRIARLQTDGADDRRRLNEAVDRVQMLRVEAAMGGRLQVMSEADVPMTPVRDNRQIYSIAAGGGGACAAAAVMVALTLARRRKPTAQVEARRPSMTLLGMLPALSEHGGDAARSMEAADAVHQVRASLQAGGRRSQTYLLTSAAAGDGKTSLTIALGLSFASTGMRTLLIDCDLESRRLTGGLRAEDDEGLFEAIFSENPGTCIRRLASGPWILPLGQVDAMHTASLSAQAIQRLLDEARKEFDVVLIDSAPILDSVEASMLSAEVDGVILAVSRGQKPGMMGRVTRHLDLIGARTAGIVINRASDRDMLRSGFGIAPRQSDRLRRHDEDANAANPGETKTATHDSDGLSGFGPLVAAVYLHLPSARAAIQQVTDQQERNNDHGGLATDPRTGAKRAAS